MQTVETKRRGTVYAINHALRRLGIPPTPYGQSPSRDFLPYQGFRLWKALASCLPCRLRTTPSH
jgi:hypothetical protein